MSARVSTNSRAELFTSGVDYLEIFEDEHSQDEDRFIAIGPIPRGVVLVVYTVPSEGLVRIISARRATRSETRLFWQHMGTKDE
jgi:uncharacterized DUF497 family protein